MFLEVDPGTAEPLMDEGDAIPLAQHRAGRRPRRVPVGARRGHARLPEAPDQRRGQGPRRARRRPARRLQALRAAPPRPRARDDEAIARRAQPEAPRPQLRPARRGARRQGPELTRAGPAGERRLPAVRVGGPEHLGVRLELPGDARRDARRRSQGRQARPAARARRSRRCGPRSAQLDDANAAVIPFAEKGTPIVRDEIRPFARIAQPYMRTSAPPPATSPRRDPT